MNTCNDCGNDKNDCNCVDLPDDEEIDFEE